MKHVLSIRDLGRDDVPRLFALTSELKARQKARDQVMPLRGRTMALIFEKPSLRTRVTFEVAMVQLGGAAVYLSAQEIGLGKRESVPDIARNLSRWVDVIGARVFTPGSHGTTFGGNPFATAVGLTVFTTLVEERLPERAERMGRLLRDRLLTVQSRDPGAVKEVRGKGLLVGMDLTAPVADVVSACRQRGLLVLSAGDNTLRLAPPLIVDEAAVERATEIIGRALGDVRA